MLIISFELFGGTDSDRIHVGDTFFWNNVMGLAPSISGEQWTEFVNEQEPGLLVIEKEEELDEDEEECDDDEEDDEDDYKPPHASYPDIFKSVLLLVLAKRILPGGNDIIEQLVHAASPSPSTILPWKFAKSTKPIMMDMHGHTWTKNK